METEMLVLKIRFEIIGYTPKTEFSTSLKKVTTNMSHTLNMLDFKITILFKLQNITETDRLS